uniref:Phytanoyl-CoA dioxygenase family protein n=1 Tax=Macrostomum lignano TaxID=282301 RepID=A0A1I8IE94_9PLAT
MARDILLQAAAEQCCRGRDFIKDLPITKVENTLAWHYDLESFLEARYTCWTYKPFTGQEEVDSRDSGHVPGPGMSS